MVVPVADPIRSFVTHDMTHTAGFMIFGALFFVVLGMLATNGLGYFYYSYMPLETFVQVKDFRAENINMSTTHLQTLTLHKQAFNPMLYYGISRLELVSDGFPDIIIYVRELSGAFTAGETHNSKVVEIPDDTPLGTYHWRTVVALKFPVNVERTTVFTTNSFNITR